MRLVFLVWFTFFLLHVALRADVRVYGDNRDVDLGR